MMWGIAPPEVSVWELDWCGETQGRRTWCLMSRWVKKMGVLGDYGQAMCPTSGVVALIDFEQYKGFDIELSMTPFVCPIVWLAKSGHWNEQKAPFLFSVWKHAGLALILQLATSTQPSRQARYSCPKGEQVAFWSRKARPGMLRDPGDLYL